MAGPARVEITPDILLQAYAAGIFPMAEDADDPSLFWVEPQRRGIIPLDGLIVSRRLARTVKSDHFDMRVDHDFDSVIAACAAPGPGRERTWINARIRRLYGELFDLGHCHTVEAWRNGKLVGGLYGVSLGAAFFGESMFHRERDASKVALVHSRRSAAARGLPAARCPVRDRPSEKPRRDGGRTEPLPAHAGRMRSQRGPIGTSVPIGVCMAGTAVLQRSGNNFLKDDALEPS